MAGGGTRHVVIRRPRKRLIHRIVRGCIFPLPHTVGRRKVLVLPGVHRMCARGAEIWTDELNIYQSLLLYYNHRVVCHKAYFKARNGTCTNAVEGMWHCLKKILKVSFGGARGKYSNWGKRYYFALFLFNSRRTPHADPFSCFLTLLRRLL